MGGDQRKDQLQIDLDLLEELIYNQSPGWSGEDHASREAEAQRPASSPKTHQSSRPDGGRISLFTSSRGSVINASELTDLADTMKSPQELFKLLNSGSGFWWLDVSSPTKQEVYGICKAFGIHPLTAEDIVTQEAGEKIEIFPSYYFACFRSYHIVEEPDGVEYEPLNVYVIVCKEGVLSFSFTSNAHALHVQKRIATMRDIIGLSSDWICYALIDDIVDSFVPPISQLEKDVDTIEDEVFIIRDADTRPFFKSIERARKASNALLRLLGDKADVIRRLTKRFEEHDNTTLRVNISMNLGDVQDHVLAMTANLAHFERILARAHSNYLATLRVNKLTQDVRTNRFLGKITLVAGVGIPLQLIGSLWGMNVFVPGEETGSLGPFFGIVGFILIVSVIMLGWAKRKRYV
ncbi:hypothetical protein BGZ63DRAFT_468330 [Mariannaea sp. PMI_226]|nr:hypothetical protein BGZ63DRAFT_468330 [Mariannaea sp. PMI_226]